MTDSDDLKEFENMDESEVISAAAYPVTDAVETPIESQVADAEELPPAKPAESFEDYKEHIKELKREYRKAKKAGPV